MRSSVTTSYRWRARSACARRELPTGVRGRNGLAERWIGSARRELLDHVVVFNERHLRRLVGEFVAYYHDDRTHYALEKETPGGRPPSVSREPRPAVVARRRLGGLHHRYDCAA